MWDSDAGPAARGIACPPPGRTPPMDQRERPRFFRFRIIFAFLRSVDYRQNSPKGYLEEIVRTSRVLAVVAASLSLVLVGLVGVAGPAQAADSEKCSGAFYVQGNEASKKKAEDEATAICLSKNYTAITLRDKTETNKIIGKGVPPVIIDDDPNPDATQAVQVSTPPPPCWGEANNCPVGDALEFAAPEYAMVGVPITMYAYTSLRPDVNSPGQFTSGTAVIAVDGVNYAGVDFVDGVAQWRFIPETPGEKVFTASEVATSGITGANAYIDTVSSSLTVVPYDPDAYKAALKRKAVDVGDKYTVVDKYQAKGAVAKRLNWRVSSSSEDTCAVYETKKGAVRAKFNAEGTCTIIWDDPKTDEEGTYSFVAKK